MKVISPGPDGRRTFAKCRLRICGRSIQPVRTRKNIDADRPSASRHRCTAVRLLSSYDKVPLPLAGTRVASVGLPIISWPLLLDHKSPIRPRVFSRLPTNVWGRLDSVGVDGAIGRRARLVPDRVEARAPQPRSRLGCLHRRSYPHRSLQQHWSSDGNETW